MYDLTFWLAYLSNALVSSANTLLCRYADFVNFLGGTEYHLGWIVGVGMVGSLLGRFTLGQSIDRFGARRLWLLTILGTTAACLVHLFIFDYRTSLIYFARVAYILMLAGVFSASMTLITARASKDRLAEVIGIFGSAGFTGVVIGGPLADLLFPSGITDRGSADRLFVVAALLCLASLPLAWLVPSGVPARHKHLGKTSLHRARGKPTRLSGCPSSFQILAHYWPGSVVAAGIVAGAALFIPPTFLPRFVADMGVHHVSGFFVLYAVTAIVVRSLLLRPFQRWGLERMIATGLVILALSQILFLTVRQPWQLILPGIVFGAGHALLFPAIVGLGSAAYPKRYRGLATTLMMATFDAGLFVGGPIAGGVLRAAESLNLPRYPAMFATICVSVLAFDAIFVFLQRRKIFFSEASPGGHLHIESPTPRSPGLTTPHPTANPISSVKEPHGPLGSSTGDLQPSPVFSAELLQVPDEVATPPTMATPQAQQSPAPLGHVPS